MHAINAPQFNLAPAWGTMNRVAINIQVQVFFDHQLSLFSGNYLGVGLLGQVLMYAYFSKKPQDVFQSGCTISNLPAMHKSCGLPSSPAFGVVKDFNFIYSIKYYPVHCVFYLHFPED